MARTEEFALEVEEVRGGRGEKSEDAGGDPISATGSEAAQ